MLRYLCLGTLAFSVWILYELGSTWPTLLLVVVILSVLGYLLQRWGYQILVFLFKVINHFVPWHRLPLPLAILNLDAFRTELREKNLYGTPKRPDLPPVDWKPTVTCSRTNDGSFGKPISPLTVIRHGIGASSTSKPSLTILFTLSVLSAA